MTIYIYIKYIITIIIDKVILQFFIFLIVHLLLLIRVFHIIVSWWFFTGDWVTASFLKSPGLFSVFWLFSVMLLFGWSPLGRQLLNILAPLVTVSKAPITIGIIVTFMFHSFFNSLARSRYLSLFSHSFIFTLWSAGTAKSTILQIFFFLLIIIRSGLWAESHPERFSQHFWFIVFHGVWMMTNLFRFPGLFIVFELLFTMLSSAWSWFYLRFPIPPSFFPTFWDCSQCTNYNWNYSHLHFYSCFLARS